MPELIFAGIPIIGILIGVLEVLKQSGFNTRFIPLTSLAFGVIFGIALFGQGCIATGVVQGLYIGLSAVGLYSGVKNTLDK